MILELFQRKRFAAGPAAELDAFSGSVEKNLSAAFGAGGGPGIVHNNLLFTV
jgi:hypothetical protein